MTEYPVQCFEHNGEPYGRYCNPVEVNSEIDLHHWKDFETFSKEHTFPFPSGTIGKTYEKDHVEVVWQQNFPWGDKSSWEYCEKPTELTPDHLDSGMKFRQIFRLLPQPVEKEPETVEEASEKWFNKLSEIPEYECLTEKNIFTLAFKAGADWQKKQEASR